MSLSPITFQGANIMECQTLPIALFVLLIAISAGVAACGLTKNKYYLVGVALLVGIVGAVLLAIFTQISMRPAGIAFAVIFTVLGLLISFEANKKRDRELWLQGLAQFLVGGALLAYTQASNLLKGISGGIIAVNIPWFIVCVLLIVLVVKTSKRKL